ncbi:hypothetical protein [Aporhodopirellula aestuarii]|uniref:Uncharacterized protein n=1 Tax=Aporhodopirellula aestuarii TaxID=2950107 RepID=A0ABT0UAJ0_9BACT|nr:hypothetical protein [Aporhodopirellula aestuarii]MCM2373920.1 hypothetical protein [Aporhodopirellula aestuarii]
MPDATSGCSCCGCLNKEYASPRSHEDWNVIDADTASTKSSQFRNHDVKILVRYGRLEDFSFSSDSLTVSMEWVDPFTHPDDFPALVRGNFSGGYVVVTDQLYFNLTLRIHLSGEDEIVHVWKGVVFSDAWVSQGAGTTTNRYSLILESYDDSIILQTRLGNAPNGQMLHVYTPAYPATDTSKIWITNADKYLFKDGEPNISLDAVRVQHPNPSLEVKSNYTLDGDVDEFSIQHLARFQEEDFERVPYDPETADTERISGCQIPWAGVPMLRSEEHMLLDVEFDYSGKVDTISPAVFDIGMWHYGIVKPWNNTPVYAVMFHSRPTAADQLVFIDEDSNPDAYDVRRLSVAVNFETIDGVKFVVLDASVHFWLPYMQLIEPAQLYATTPDRFVPADGVWYDYASTGASKNILVARNTTVLQVYGSMIWKKVMPTYDSLADISSAIEFTYDDLTYTRTAGRVPFGPSTVVDEDGRIFQYDTGGTAIDSFDDFQFPDDAEIDDTNLTTTGEFSVKINRKILGAFQDWKVRLVPRVAS